MSICNAYMHASQVHRDGKETDGVESRVKEESIAKETGGGIGDESIGGGEGGEDESIRVKRQQHEKERCTRRTEDRYIPENPLEDDNAVERWLKRVYIFNEGESKQEEDGEADRGEEEERKEDSKALDRDDMCVVAKGDSSTDQEGYAEVEEAAAARISSKMNISDEEKSWEEEEKETERETAGREVALRETDRFQEGMHASKETEETVEGGKGEEETEEPSPSEETDVEETLFKQLARETESDAPGDGVSKQQQQQETAAAAAAATAARQGVNEEEERERMHVMEKDFKERVSLDDVGREGLSKQHSAELWRLLERRTAAAAAALSESLRIVLQPTTHGGWEGGYRSGKKLSLRRVLAFIASSQRDNRLWLRRRRPSGLHYRVLLGIDCSKSMQQLNAAASALEAVVLITQAFNLVQIGTVSVCIFGGPKPEVCIHPTSQVTAAEGQQLLQRCSFREESQQSHEVAVSDLLQLAIKELERDDSSSSSSSSATPSMILILSDGRFNKEHTRPWVSAAISRRCIPLLVILDPQQQQNTTSSMHNNGTLKPPQPPSGVEVPSEGPPGGPSGGPSVVPRSVYSSSIFELRQVHQQPDGSLEVTPYLQDFPFPYYAVVRDVKQLPSVIAQVVRQFVEAAASEW